MRGIATPPSTLRPTRCFRPTAPVAPSKHRLAKVRIKKLPLTDFVGR